MRETCCPNVREQLVDEVFGDTRTRRNTHRRDALEPLLLDFARVIDAVRSTGAGLKGNFDEANRVRRVRRPNDEDEVAVGCNLFDGDLAVLRRVANVVTRRILQVRESGAQATNGLHGLVDRQRGLRQPNQILGVRNLDDSGFFRVVNECRLVGRMAHRAFDLFVTFVADEQDVKTCSRKSLRFAVNLGDKRAGRIDGHEIAVERIALDLRRDAVSAEHQV